MAEDSEPQTSLSMPSTDDWGVDVLLQDHMHFAQEATLWGLEAAKHIALISLAGLGGVFSLIAANKVGQLPATASVLCFAMASFLCLLSMYLTHLARLEAARNMLIRLQIARRQRAGTPIDGELVKKSDRLVLIGNSVAWVAVMLIIIGGIILYLDLLSAIK
jgi:hypothetical protein